MLYPRYLGETIYITIMKSLEQLLRDSLPNSLLANDLVYASFQVSIPPLWDEPTYQLVMGLSVRRHDTTRAVVS